MWKMFKTAMALAQNHYPVWRSGRRLRLLRQLVGTTTNDGIVEDISNCYIIWSEPLPNTVMGG